jgi:hypothetical protein
VPAATPTRTIGPCVGDLDGNGELTVDEIVTAVNLGEVTTEELVRRVSHALAGCG